MLPLLLTTSLPDITGSVVTSGSSSLSPLCPMRTPLCMISFQQMTFHELRYSSIESRQLFCAAASLCQTIQAVKPSKQLYFMQNPLLPVTLTASGPCPSISNILHSISSAAERDYVLVQTTIMCLGIANNFVRSCVTRMR